MSKRINSYQAVASFVRGFFEAYARGIMDAAVGGDDFQKKNDPKEVKQMMLEHYGEGSLDVVLSQGFQDEWGGFGNRTIIECEIHRMVVLVHSPYCLRI
jgi:hypothetical protein